MIGSKSRFIICKMTTMICWNNLSVLLLKINEIYVIRIPPYILVVSLGYRVVVVKWLTRHEGDDIVIGMVKGLFGPD